MEIATTKKGNKMNTAIISTDERLLVINTQHIKVMEFYKNTNKVKIHLETNMSIDCEMTIDDYNDFVSKL